MSEKVSDGATLRRVRLMDIISFIARWERDKGPVSDLSIQTFMLLKHGNRKDTVVTYLRELTAAGVLRQNPKNGGWELVQNYERTLATFAALGEQ